MSYIAFRASVIAKYVNVSIHEDLAKKIDKYIKESGDGYRSRAEVVSDAVRRLIGIKKKISGYTCNLYNIIMFKYYRYATTNRY